jgi:hypothetical protein
VADVEVVGQAENGAFFVGEHLRLDERRCFSATL